MGVPGRRRALEAPPGEPVVTFDDHMPLYIAPPPRLDGFLVIVIVLLITLRGVLPASDGDRRSASPGKPARPDATARADPASPRTQPSVLHRVRLLREELLHRRLVRLARPRLLVRELRLGPQRGDPARAADAVPDRRRLDHLARSPASRSASSRRSSAGRSSTGARWASPCSASPRRSSGSA